MTREESARAIFGEHAAFYTTSTTHKDPKVLARVVELADPKPDWRALDIATGTGQRRWRWRRMWGTWWRPT